MQELNTSQKAGKNEWTFDFSEVSPPPQFHGK